VRPRKASAVCPRVAAATPCARYRLNTPRAASDIHALLSRLDEPFYPLLPPRIRWFSTATTTTTNSTTTTTGMKEEEFVWSLHPPRGCRPPKAAKLPNATTTTRNAAVALPIASRCGRRCAHGTTRIPRIRRVRQHTADGALPRCGRGALARITAADAAVRWTGTTVVIWGREIPGRLRFGGTASAKVCTELCAAESGSDSGILGNRDHSQSSRPVVR
jgi:hypothetical protein